MHVLKVVEHKKVLPFYNFQVQIPFWNDGQKLATNSDLTVSRHRTSFNIKAFELSLQIRKDNHLKYVFTKSTSFTFLWNSFQKKNDITFKKRKRSLQLKREYKISLAFTYTILFIFQITTHVYKKASITYSSKQRYSQRDVLSMLEWQTSPIKLKRRVKH